MKNIKSLTPFICLFLTFTFATAQAKVYPIKNSFAPASTLLTDNVVFHIDLLSPGLFAEVNLYGDATLFAGYQYGAMLSYNSKEENGKVNDVNFLPQVMVNYRHYYNVNERIINNRETDKFSADYVGWHLSRVFETEINEAIWFTGPVWGLQRNLAEIIHVNFSVGAGYYFSSANPDTFNHFSIIADLHFGFSL